MYDKEDQGLVVVAGEDMSPTIKVGEVLKVEYVPPDQIRVGDVIVFHRYVLIAHRVLGILRKGSEYFFFTHGDRCKDIDSPVHFGSVLGRVLGKSVRMTFRTRDKVLLASLLLWYLLASSLLSNPVIRRFHKIELHITSVCLCQK